MNTFLIYFNGQPMRGMYFMKSIVFSFKKRYLFRRSKGISPSDVRFFIRRYSVVLIFVSAFLTGLVFGSIYASKADKQMLDSLDFLFTTNLDASHTVVRFGPLIIMPSIRALPPIEVIFLVVFLAISCSFLY